MKNGKFVLTVAAALLCASLIALEGANGAVVTAATTTAATTAKAAVTTAATTVKAATTVAATTAKAATTTVATAAATTTKAAATTTAKAAVTTTLAAATTAKTAATNATTARVATTAQAPATTTAFVPVPESQCHMPFWHNGGWHHTCVKYNDFGDYWCSLTRNFTSDEVWKRCRSADLKRFQCHIPFEFEGKNHTQCLPVEPNSAQGRGAHHSFWCAVVPKIVSWSATGTDWAYCEHGEATGVTYLKQVGIHHDIASAQRAAGINITAGGEAVDPSAKDKSPSKSLSGANAAAGGHGASGAAAGLGAEATVGISVGVVCSVLAVIAVVAGVAIRKRRRSGQDHKALLQTREKGTYGGMEASD